MTPSKRTTKDRPGDADAGFGQRVRQWRSLRSLTQTDLASRMNVSVSYISKVENEKLHFGDYPSEKFIHKLAVELKADEDELLLLADKVPPTIRKRIREQPAEFRRLAQLDHKTLARLVNSI
ncbi:MAG: helix-turn-helix transcriptional regulator [Rubripirellula sp.]